METPPSLETKKQKTWSTKMADERVYQIKGGYYPPGSAPKEHIAQMEAMQKLYPNQYQGNWQSSWWGQPFTKEVPESQVIFGRRPDVAKRSMETMKMGFDTETMGNLLDAYRNAQTIDPTFPKLSYDQLLRIALEEGRSNFGYNEWDVNNKKLQGVVASLKQLGHDDYSAGFAAALKEKYDTAKRLGRSFEEVWNGAGPKARNYASRIQKGMYSVEHPDNQQLREFIKYRISPEKRSEVNFSTFDNPLMTGEDFYG